MLASIASVVGLASLGAAEAEDMSDGPARFHDVKGWRGTLIASAQADAAAVAQHDALMRRDNPRARTSFEFGAFMEVEFVLDDYESDPSVWRGRVTNSRYESGYRHFIHVPDIRRTYPGWKGYAEHEWVFNANGAMDFSGDPRVELQFHRQRGWSVRLASGRVATEVRTHYFGYTPPVSEQDPAHDFIIAENVSRRESHSTQAVGMGSTGTLPYPKERLLLFASGQKKKDSFPLFAGAGLTPPVEWDYSIYLEPTSFDELRVEIEEPPSYKTWRPETTPQRGAGEPLAVTARVVTAKGGTPKIAVDSFEWELIGTSREPGVAMNFPIDATDNRPDLELDADGAMFVREKENQRLVRAVRSGFSDTAKVVPYDWGGWSTLQVTAVMSDGRRLRGKVKGRPEAGLLVPKRKQDSHIADGWKVAKGQSGADALDDEKIAGQPMNGDGFTLYQEYRGFVVDGRHLEGDPTRKDFFVRNLVGADAQAGIDLFASVSQLAVHDRLRGDEMSEATRLMNGNRRQGAQVEKQHGVWIKTFGSKSELGDNGAQTVMLEKGVAGRPGKVKGIGLLARDNAESAFNQPFNLPAQNLTFAYDRAIAHELLHSVGVEHHGAGDYGLIVGYVSERNPWNKIGRPYYAASIDGPPIDLRTEQGEDLAAKNHDDYLAMRRFNDLVLLDRLLEEGRQYIARNGADYNPNFSTPEKYADFHIELLIIYCVMNLRGTVGAERGEHSGAQDCMMRYYFAQFAESKAGKDKYYFLEPGTEPIGVLLCRDSHGTGVNAAGRTPQSRYGDAAADCGNCFAQICPNDAVPPRKVK